MVQLYKKLVSFVLSLFKKENELIPLLEFNMQELASKMEKASLDLHRYKGDDGVSLIKMAINTARNIQMLEIHKIKQGSGFEKEFSYHLGRINALADLHTFIELSFDDSQYELLRGRNKETVKKRVLTKNYGHAGPVI